METLANACSAGVALGRDVSGPGAVVAAPTRDHHPLPRGDSVNDPTHIDRRTPRVDPIVRFWSKVDRSGDGCWEWTARSRMIGGYGAFALSKAGHTWRVGAHRYAYEITYGPIPAGLNICHHCDNPPCCNPSHLFAGTSLDNTRDMFAKGRNRRGTPIPRSGESHPRAKLTWENVREIRKALPHTGTTALGRQYGVSPMTIHAIKTGRTWK